MAFVCPECGSGLEPGATARQMLTCPACRRTIRVRERKRAGEEEATYEFTSDNVAFPIEKTPDELMACPVCGHVNDAQSTLCTECRAELRRKYRTDEKITSADAAIAQLPVSRRRLSTLLFSALGVAIVVVTIWMVSTLVRGIETPTFAFQRIASLSKQGAWDRVYDRIHPQTRAVILATLRNENAAPPIPDKELFVAAMKAQPDRYGSLFSPDLHVVGQKETNDHTAEIYATAPGRATETIIMMKDHGVWKLSFSE